MDESSLFLSFKKEVAVLACLASAGEAEFFGEADALEFAGGALGDFGEEDDFAGDFEGGEAFGFAVWPATRAAIDTLIAPLVIGRDERDMPALLADVQRKLHLLGRTGPVMFAISGLDIALWDIAGKAAGKSLADLLGGARRTDFAAIRQSANRVQSGVLRSLFRPVDMTRANDQMLFR